MTHRVTCTACGSDDLRVRIVSSYEQRLRVEAHADGSSSVTLGEQQSPKLDVSAVCGACGDPAKIAWAQD